jgi:CheY-like chemotaxis protein
MSNHNVTCAFNIMLVDDEPIFNFLNEEIIRFSNVSAQVSSFISPRQALEWLQQHDADQWPGVILLDINMPLMTGWEFLNEFENLPGALTGRCKVFILSSSTDPRDVVRSKSYKSVYQFYEKPLTPETLDEIARIVEGENPVAGGNQ